jgi:hypothetical protein
LYSTKWSYGKRKKEWKLHSSKNNSTEDLLGNEENRYPVSNPNKTIINVNNELCNAHKKKIPQRGNHGRNH